MRLLRTIAALLMIASLVAPLRAAAGELDRTFGSGGRVTTGSGRILSIALQRDGKIVAVGDILLVRHNSDGTLDTSFGSGGKVGTDFGGRVLIQPDGNILVAGAACHAGPDGPDCDLALLRYSAGGMPDNTFGSAGKVITQIGGYLAISDAAIQPDGKIVAVGFAGRDLLLARYYSNGAPDTTFGSGGKVTTRHSGYEESHAVILVQRDGKIVTAGQTCRSPGACFAALARYSDNGALDATFGSGGKITAGFGEYDGIAGAALQPDGNIVAAGSAIRGFAVARYNGNGTLDSTFGSGGILKTNFGYGARARGMALQRDGKIVVIGVSFGAIGTTQAAFALGRYLSNGTLDKSFGSGGLVFTKFGALSRSDPAAMVIQPDGKIVVAGHAVNLENFRGGGAVLVRYLGRN